MQRATPAAIPTRMFAALKEKMVAAAEKIDNKIRWWDLRFNRTDEGSYWQRKLPIVPRHSPAIIPLGIIVLLTVTNGPHLLQWRGIGSLVVALLAVTGLTIAVRATQRRGQPVLTSGMEGIRGWLPLFPWLACLVFAVAVTLGWLSWDFNLGFVLLALGLRDHRVPHSLACHLPSVTYSSQAG